MLSAAHQDGLWIGKGFSPHLSNIIERIPPVKNRRYDSLVGAPSSGRRNRVSIDPRAGVLFPKDRSRLIKRGKGMANLSVGLFIGGHVAHPNRRIIESQGRSGYFPHTRGS